MSPKVRWSAVGGKVTVATTVEPGALVAFVFEGVSDKMDREEEEEGEEELSTEINSQKLVRLLDTLPIQSTAFLTRLEQNSTIVVHLMNPNRNQTLWFQRGPVCHFPCRKQDRMMSTVPTFDLFNVLLAACLVSETTDVTLDGIQMILMSSVKGSHLECSIQHVTTKHNKPHPTNPVRITGVPVYCMYHLLNRSGSHPFFDVGYTEDSLVISAGGYPAQVRAEFTGSVQVHNR